MKAIEHSQHEHCDDCGRQFENARGGVVIFLCSTYICVCIYIYTHTYICVYMYAHIYTIDIYILQRWGGQYPLVLEGGGVPYVINSSVFGRSFHKILLEQVIYDLVLVCRCIVVIFSIFFFSKIRTQYIHQSSSLIVIGRNASQIESYNSHK